MYELTFSLEKRPFAAAPLTDRYYPAATIESARKTLIRAIERAEGPALVIGPAGIGKTLLCHLVADHFRRAFRVALLASTHVGTRKALFQNILFELGLPYRDMEEGELRLALVDHLEPSERCPHGLLLIIDEAHTLPLRLMEEIRMISNLMRDQTPRVRLILAGGPALEERFSSPKLDSFNQRIAARCYLHSLGKEETTAYVQTQLARVGGDANLLFGDDAYRAIFNATDGVPRLINQVCDHALLLASLGGKRHIDAGAIEEAWSDLQQLPAPFREHEHREPASETGVVEFGDLADEGDSPASPVSRVERGLLKVEQGIGAFAADLSGGAAEYDAFDLSFTPSAPVEDAHPSRLIRPEIELYFHGPHDPFGEVFEEEEVVIDRYASLDDHAGKAHIRVSSGESRELAEVLASSQAFAAAGASGAPLTVEFGGQVSAAGDGWPSGDVHGKPVSAPPVVVREFEAPLSFTAVAWPSQESPPAAANSEIDEPVDDRDLIRIEDQDLASLPTGRGRARRQEYKQLFARLRNSQ